MPSKDPQRPNIVLILADGGLICVATAAPQGTTKHSEEETVSAVSHPRGYIEFEEVLLSTEYDGAGRQIRATLELWPASDEIAVLHGAGSVISGSGGHLPWASPSSLLIDVRGNICQRAQGGRPYWASKS